MTEKEILQELHRPGYIWRSLTQKKEKFENLFDMATNTSSYIEITGIRTHSAKSKIESAMEKRDDLREQMSNDFAAYLDAQHVIQKRINEMPYPEKDCIEIQYLYHKRYIKPYGCTRKVADIRESAIRIYAEIANRQTENE